MIVIAIDIGVTGAVACIRHDRSSAVTDLPIENSGILFQAEDKRLDAKALHHMLLDWVTLHDRVLLVCEDVRPRSIGNGGRPTNSMHSQGTMMRIRGGIEAVASVGCRDVKWVQPQTWKRFYGIKRDKEETEASVKERGRQMALKLFPEHEHNLRFKYHHNRADALLMAHWGRSTQL